MLKIRFNYHRDDMDWLYFKLFSFERMFNIEHTAGYNGYVNYKDRSKGIKQYCSGYNISFRFINNKNKIVYPKSQKAAEKELTSN